MSAERGSGRFANERVMVVGAGVAGTSAARVLVQEGARVRVGDVRPRAALDDADGLEALGVELRAGGHDVSDLDDVTLVVISPGVPPSADLLLWAHERELPVWGELELGARLANAPYLAVTGTNGKTTTTGMLAACLRAAGLDAIACGNIGHPFPAAAREHHDALVVEVSSFQLTQQTSFHPRVSVLLNLAPDHLDWHRSFDEYARAKARIYANQRGDDVHVGNREDPGAARLSSAAPCRRLWFGTGEPPDGDVGYVADRLVVRADGDADLGAVDDDLAGFRADAAAAAAAALAFGVDPEAVRVGLASYVPARHRGETVAQADGVRFIDNSKATNVHAALAALAGVHDAVLIAGGRAKGQDLSELATRSDRVVAVVALGESADDVVRIFQDVVPVRKAGSIEEAARTAFELAPRPGAVLLAPACASWDQFRDYAERGERFAAAAARIERDGGAHG